MDIKKIGVVGCGVMGSGIAQVCALSGYMVVVSESSVELLNKGMAYIQTALQKSVEKGRLTPSQMNEYLNRIKPTLNAKDFAECNLIIEAATENLELKKKIFQELDAICSPDTILASNTSSQPILNLAVITRRPEKVLGLHFFNPVPIMKLVEIVKTIATSNETVEICMEFGKKLGKLPVIANDTGGFIVNFLLTSFIMNAIRMVESGKASKEDIDVAIKEGLNHPMGPLALADLIGNDVLLAGTASMYEEFKDPQFAPPPLLVKMATAGWLGRKTGKGFYSYT